jgi:hypothetical protein
MVTSSPPASIQVDGVGMTTTYGMPHVQIWNSLGTKIAEVVATSVTDNGTVLKAPGPGISNASTGTYGLQVLNVASNGSLSPVGAAPMPIIYVDPNLPPPVCPPPPQECYK